MSEPIKWKELDEQARNILVHEKVMGQSAYCTGDVQYLPEHGCFECYECRAGIPLMSDETKPHVIAHLPQYTTSMDAAWQVIKRFTVSVELIYTPGRDSYCKIQPPIGEPVYGVAENPAEAICIAALRVVLRPVGIEVLV